WWAIMGSIVATETSTVTFISVPGYAYTTNFTFLQLVMGYMIGRLAVSVLFIPAYFRGEIITVYQLLGTRFGTPVKRLASSLFLATRTLADGFRLFATGLVLAALLRATPGLAGYSTNTILVASVLIMGVATIIYTYEGGMTAVIWTDVIQLVIYLIGALLAAWILVERVSGGWPEIAAAATAAGKFRTFDFTFDLTRSYTFWSGVVGGAFLTTATHGTDQLMVQRYFCAKSPGDARKALLWSGVVVFAQFALFLLIGAMLYVFYTGQAPQEIASFTRDGRVMSDRIFPNFIVQHLPTGAVGLVLAAIFAAAMSTLASSLNSSSAASMTDFYIPATGGRRSEAHYLRVSRVMTAVWGGLQIIVAIVAIKLSSRVVDEVLGIASFTNGIILGMFLLGTLTRRVGQTAAFVGIIVGAAVMLWLKLFTAVSWQWYVLAGSMTTFFMGTLASLAVKSEGPAPPAR
ncbi:MAG TPA: sodium:solute symporter, partial [Vicinamibacterales bacterium]|nr:sodium:solute symporter [Vicinamibacterales bacterium]